MGMKDSGTIYVSDEFTEIQVDEKKIFGATPGAEINKSNTKLFNVFESVNLQSRESYRGKNDTKSKIFSYKDLRKFHFREDSVNKNSQVKSVDTRAFRKKSISVNVNKSPKVSISKYIFSGLALSLKFPFKIFKISKLFIRLIGRDLFRPKRIMGKVALSINQFFKNIKVAHLLSLLKRSGKSFGIKLVKKQFKIIFRITKKGFTLLIKATKSLIKGYWEATKLTFKTTFRASSKIKSSNTLFLFTIASVVGIVFIVIVVLSRV
jgi:hypothetical protein